MSDETTGSDARRPDPDELRSDAQSASEPAPQPETAPQQESAAQPETAAQPERGSHAASLEETESTATPPTPSAPQTQAIETPSTETTEAPTTEAPTTEAPTTEAPATEAPGTADETAAPAGEEPAVAAASPRSGVPASDVPESGVPGSDVPVSDVPAGETGPRPTPAVVAGTVHVGTTPPEPVPVVAPTSNAAEFGRVDEEGRVFVRTSTGEREVGQYPGAPAEEALSYYTRKYDEILGQVELLVQRVSTGGVSGKEGLATVEKLRASLVDAQVVGDLDGLDARLAELVPVLEKRAAKAEADRAKARERARRTKETIVSEAESVAQGTRWKADGDRLRELFEAWKAAPRLDRKADDELWARFRAARTTFDKRRRAHFAELDAERGEISARKERLVAEAESLAGSKDWGPTSARFRQLMNDWKAAGRASRDDEDRLWGRFRAAQDSFFSARNEVFAERDAEYKGNLEAKLALLEQAEALLPVTDLRAAKSALRSIQERWEKAGRVPRGDVDRVEGRMRRVEEAIRSAEDSEWRRTNPEARARAEGTVTQLRDSIAALERRADQARARGDEKAAADAEAAVEARRSWLAEAEKTLAEFSR